MPPRTDDPLTGGLRLPLLTVVVAVLAGVASAGPLFDRLDASLDPAPSTESERTEAELVAATGVDGSLVALLEAPEVDLSTLPGRVEALPGVGDAELVPSSVEPEAVVMVATVAAELDDDGRERLVAEFVEVVEGTAAETTVGGSLALDQELADTAESDLLRADALAVPVILLLFGLLLGGVRVALVPLAIVVVVLAGSLPILLALSAVTTVSVFAVNVVTLFGVGLAVDYGLLVVSRFREELAGGAGVETGLAVTRATAGRAVVYSGLTVATSLAALLVFEEPVLRSLAYGGMAATLLSVVAAHWLLQPLLRRSAHRLRPAQAVDPDRGRIAALARRIQERPALVAAGTVAVLLAAATPLGSINFEGLDARSLPGGSPTRDLVERLAESHPDLPLAPVQVLVDAPIDADSAVELVEAIESAPRAGA
ncbi:MAG: MMPL family transporter, partial [Actinomycetota bacterium]